MGFSEALKINVRKQAHFSCCLCKKLEVEVHHIVPQSQGERDTLDNAAPLCASCHTTYGANPEKRKLIREARDHWYEICRTRYAAEPKELEEIRRLLRDVAKRNDVSELKGHLVQPNRRIMLGRGHEPTNSSALGSSSPTKRDRLEIGAQKARGVSHTGSLCCELRGDPHGAGAEIWLSQSDSEDYVKLCDTEGWGNLRVHFAPDDNSIIVQDGGASMGIHLRVFSRDTAQRRITFYEKDADVGGKAEKFALKQAAAPASLSLDHRYVRCLLWSEDSRFVLISMNGKRHASDQAYRANWIGVYSLAENQVTTDLSCFNRNSIASYTFG